MFTYGNDGYKRDGTGRQDGLSRTLKPAPKGNLLELHESDCGFESHRTLSYKNTLDEALGGVQYSTYLARSPKLLVCFYMA